MPLNMSFSFEEHVFSIPYFISVRISYSRLSAHRKRVFHSNDASFTASLRIKLNILPPKITTLISVFFQPTSIQQS